MEGFESRLKKLEEMAERIQDRDIPLEEAMELFNRGVELSRKLEEELQGYERRVEMLQNSPPEDGSGRAELAEFPE